MSLQAALVGTFHVLALTLIFQGLELLIATWQASFFKIWSYENLKSDLERGMPLPNSLVRLLFANSSFRFILLLQILTAAATFFLPVFPFFLVLLLTHLLICIRFRGTFNGGSDMMIFVVLTGVLIALVSSEEKIQKLGLIYIAIHTLYSYFKSGLSKVIQKDWRDGSALPTFLDRSLLIDVRQIAKWLMGQKWLCLGLCWIVLIFELSAIGLPLAPHLASLYFAGVLLFHFGIYVSFGLNRFFWAWLCAWPAVFFSISLFR
jgi:hypothetical protein